MRTYWNTESFKKRINDLTNGEYDVLGEYESSNKKIKFLHKRCNSSFEMKPNNFVSNGQRCPFCNSNFYKYDIEKIRAIFLEKGLELLDDNYKNEKSSLKARCLKCGDISSYKFANLRTRTTYGCNICNGVGLTKASHIKKEIEKGGDYELLTNEAEIKTVHTTLQIKHLECGLIYKNSYNNFRNGQRCPLCSRKSASGGLSKEFRKVVHRLLADNYEFELEKKYEGFIIRERQARYDIFIPKFNLLIEYHGIQHFKYFKTGYFNKKKFEEIKESDALKENYAKQHNINLEYIIYLDNAEEKLSEILAKYEKI